MKKTTFLPLIVVVFSLIISSCDDKYNNQLRDLGTRVEILENSVLQMNQQTEDLYKLVKAIEGNGYITKIEKNADGSYTLIFNDGSSYTLRDGKDGDDANMTISVKKHEDGFYYWWIIKDNVGTWLLDDNDNKVRAGGVDGKDGIVPKWRIKNGKWEISYDNGTTWISTGVNANGEDGRPDRFKEIKYCDEHSGCIKVTMTDQRVFHFPIYEFNN